ncbi:hypothetical protein GUITHDRAFT_145392 [Guillardia theta CCMP2712]|uniref:Uncharacterized protein n=1 Tax=Guillardia theta (strain CCMP2712) TaxID=905079 RepID=L1IKW5_GUITC|nr:hypothetical protein GUITHDRAFT_145392 [Guillardia theta CCMP2712]EKX36893.1 hypothetical protein GUITHDRAFT_145392 [Guillardia theta CCMP2712]|mmetsp:Transcript_46046/g.144429  ORF Transcript_46046/g.144429 Transcript_46046/m.144429 type:complete len:224 (+) Transcript_46046:247-918(+)|eukprot:XP_005823873.1 hypothetical protein GUITHDRAFT_145392 [Guillardia theta CCMP2712]
MAQEMLPRAGSFLFCMSLRCGLQLIAVCDFFASLFRLLSGLIIVASPDLFFDAETSFIDMSIGMSAKRIFLRSVRLQLLLSLPAIYFSWYALSANRSGNLVHLRQYCNWKVLKCGVTLMMHSLLHRIWWDGCGYLPLSSCWEVRNDILFTAFLNLVPSLYCIWIVWSSYYLILDGDLQALWLAGFNFGDPRQFDKSQYQEISKGGELAEGGEEPPKLNVTYFV